MNEPKFYRRFDYDRKLLPNQFLSRLEQDVHDLEQAKTKTGYSVGYPGWNLLYYCLYSSLRKDAFNLIIETGSNWGCSTIILGQGLIDSGYAGIVHSVEIDKANFEKAQLHIKSAGVSSRVNLHHQDSVNFISHFDFQGPVTFAFLDGDHRRETVFKEFSLLYPHMDHKTIVFFDNTYLIDPVDGRVNKALYDIKKCFGGNLVNFENTSWFTPGQAVWQMDPFRDDW